MGMSSGRWTQAAHHKRTNFRYPIKVTVEVDHPHAMVKCSLGDEEIGDRGPVPHAVMMREVLLEPKCSREDIFRG